MYFSNGDVIPRYHSYILILLRNSFILKDKIYCFDLLFPSITNSTTTCFLKSLRSFIHLVLITLNYGRLL